MATVYLVCETVDLGYHAVAGFFDEKEATSYMTKLIHIAKSERIAALRKINYTQQMAEDFVNSISFYELDSVTVE